MAGSGAGHDGELVAWGSFPHDGELVAWGAFPHDGELVAWGPFPHDGELVAWGSFPGHRSGNASTVWRAPWPGVPFLAAGSGQGLRFAPRRANLFSITTINI